MISKGEYCLPAEIAGRDVMIRTDVVESDIPMLLSRSAMKKASVKLDMEHDRATIFGKTVPINVTSQGHYCVPIIKSCGYNTKISEPEVRSRMENFSVISKKRSVPVKSVKVSVSTGTCKSNKTQLNSASYADVLKRMNFEDNIQSEKKVNGIRQHNGHDTLKESKTNRNSTRYARRVRPMLKY